MVVFALGTKYRTRMDVYSEILSAVMQPVRKTHIMCVCNLSYNQLCEYIDTLIGCDLIKEVSEDGVMLYNVTSKGLTFLKLFEDLSECLSDIKEKKTPESKIHGSTNPAVFEKKPFTY